MPTLFRHHRLILLLRPSAPTVESQERPRAWGRSALRAGFAVLLWLQPSPLASQWIDAQLPLRGELQFGLTGLSATVNGRFLPDGTRQPSSAFLAVELDAQVAPALDTLDAVLAGLFPNLGLAAPQTSTLGPVSYDILFEQTRVPLSLTLGITGWLAPFVNVPFVRGRSFVVPQVDSAQALAGPGGSAFGGSPDLFLSGLNSSIVQLESIVAADTLPAGEQAAAAALLADAQTLETGLTDISDETYVPTGGGANGQALLQFYEALRSGFEGFQVTLPDLELAQAVNGQEATALTSGPQFGIDPPSSQDTGWKFGDIEAGVSVQPINTFGRSPSRGGSKFRVRGKFDALWRFATGSEPAASQIGDLGSGDGQPDLELRSAFDVAWGRRLWLSAFAGYNIQFAGDIERLITDPAAPIQIGAYTTPVRWDPGDILTLGVAPRFNLAQAVTISFVYFYQHHGMDEVTPTAGTVTDDAFSLSDIEIGTEYSTESLGFAIRYSSTSWTGEERGPAIPAEVELRYSKTVSGSQGFAPDVNVWQVGVRYYLKILP